jgi:ring-1,2-phenylacetyl-CoA epoxidase subunit PaaD
MVTTKIREEEVWKALEAIADPELPVISIVQLKIIRSVVIRDDEVCVEITPTFVGCPALETISESIGKTLTALGFKTVRVERNFAAQWSTDLLDADARSKLQQVGIAPPFKSAMSHSSTPVPCPYCNSTDTRVENPFGATLCKKLCYCNSCKQSFEQFRAI